ARRPSTRVGEPHDATRFARRLTDARPRRAGMVASFRRPRDRSAGAAPRKTPARNSNPELGGRGPYGAPREPPPTLRRFGSPRLRSRRDSRLPLRVSNRESESARFSFHLASLFPPCLTEESKRPTKMRRDSTSGTHSLVFS